MFTTTITTQQDDPGTCFANVRREPFVYKGRIPYWQTGDRVSHMRKRERDSVVKKIDGSPDEKPGHPICIRPFEADEKKLDEIVRETGEEKSAIVRRMIRFALSDKYERFGANPCRDRLDLLIEQGRRNGIDSDRVDKLVDRVTQLEEENMAASQETSVFLREIYSLSGLSVLVLNIILPRLIELTSARETDKEKISLAANGTMRNVIAQTILDLDKCCSFHGIDSGPQLVDELYFATRINGLAGTRFTSNLPETEAL